MTRVVNLHRRLKLFTCLLSLLNAVEGWYDSPPLQLIRRAATETERVEAQHSGGPDLAVAGACGWAQQAPGAQAEAEGGGAPGPAGAAVGSRRSAAGSCLSTAEQ